MDPATAGKAGTGLNDDAGPAAWQYKPWMFAVPVLLPDMRFIGARMISTLLLRRSSTPTTLFYCLVFVLSGIIHAATWSPRPDLVVGPCHSRLPWRHLAGT